MVRICSYLVLSLLRLLNPVCYHVFPRRTHSSGERSQMEARLLKPSRQVPHHLWRSPPDVQKLKAVQSSHLNFLTAVYHRMSDRARCPVQQMQILFSGFYSIYAWLYLFSYLLTQVPDAHSGNGVNPLSGLAPGVNPWLWLNLNCISLTLQAAGVFAICTNPTKI